MFTSFSPRLILTLGVILILSTVLCYLLPSVVPPLKVAENWVQDFRVASLTKTEEHDSRIVVVTINEDTLKRFPYRSPIDREFLAKVITRIQNAGAIGIALDVLLDTPTVPEKDQALKAVLDKARIPIIASYSTPQASGDRLDDEQLQYLNKFTKNVHRGFSNVIADPSDQVIRSIYPGYLDEDSGQFFPGFAQLLVQAAGVEADQREPIPLDYRGHPAEGKYGFMRRPAHTVLQFPENILKKWFDKKLVLIGADLSDLDLDVKRTPWHTTRDQAGFFPGVLVHAYATSQLLDQREFPQISKISHIILIFVLTMLGAALGRAEINVLLLVFISLSTIITYWVLGFLLFYYEIGPMLPLVFPSLALVIGLGSSVVFFGGEEREQKKFIKEAFSRYLSPDLVGQLVENPDGLRIQGEKRELSFIFTDVAGFTSFTEAVEPELLVQVLNEYLDGICRIVMENRGTIDKFIGDAVFVIFGAPVVDLGHAANAVRCALSLDEYASEFHKRMTSIGIPFGQTRIGVHTGVATVGNFGSESRFEYTALGDAVNAAARLESLNKQFGTTTAISGDTVREAEEQTRDAVRFRPIASVIVKGKTEPIDIYQPVTLEEGDSPLVLSYGEAYGMMKDGRAEAARAFDSLRDRFPDDILIRLHQKRLSEIDTPTHVIKLEEK